LKKASFGSSLFSVDSGGKEEGMTPEKLSHELLGLGLNWKVTECEFDRESRAVRLRIDELEHLWKVERSPDKGGRSDLLFPHRRDGVEASQCL
jgi:hypothetical protein